MEPRRKRFAAFAGLSPESCPATRAAYEAGLGSEFHFRVSIFEFRVSIIEFRFSIFESKPGQLIQAVKRGGLVAFGQRRIIEDRVHEVFDRAFQDEDRVPDVESLGCAVASDVTA